MQKADKHIPLTVNARFSFFAVLGFMLCTDKEGTALLCLAACALHELGHLAVMLSERRPPSSITFYGGGIHISGGSGSLLSVAGGCLMNLLLFFVFYFCFGDRRLRLFGVINLLLALFNLLPIRELDGKLLTEKLLLRILPAEKAIKAGRYCDIIFTALAAPVIALFVLSGALNFSALVFFLYLTALDIFEKIP